MTINNYYRLLIVLSRLYTKDNYNYYLLYFVPKRLMFGGLTIGSICVYM